MRRLLIIAALLGVAGCFGSTQRVRDANTGLTLNSGGFSTPAGGFSSSDITIRNVWEERCQAWQAQHDALFPVKYAECVTARRQERGENLLATYRSFSLDDEYCHDRAMARIVEAIGPNPRLNGMYGTTGALYSPRFAPTGVR